MREMRAHRQGDIEARLYRPAARRHAPRPARRSSRAARAASPVRDPPGAALTWVRRCPATWLAELPCRSPTRSAPIVYEVSANRLRGQRRSSTRSAPVIVICRSPGRSAPIVYDHITPNMPHGMSIRTLTKTRPIYEQSSLYSFRRCVGDLGVFFPHKAGA
jgi:hypothetical protein